MTYEEFSGREGDIVTGIIQQDSHRYTLLDLGKVEALLPRRSRCPPNLHAIGERLKAFIGSADRQGPADHRVPDAPGLLRKLFEFEVPEIAEGIVEIKAVAGSPGTGPRSPSPPTSRAWTRWGPAWGPRAHGSGWW